MAIEDRNLPEGTRLVAKFKGATYYATVVRGMLENGIYVTVNDGSKANTLGCRMDDGRAFKSLSAAGSAIMDGTACNGWRFWSVDKDGPGYLYRKADGEEPTGEQTEETKAEAEQKEEIDYNPAKRCCTLNEPEQTEDQKAEEPKSHTRAAPKPKREKKAKTGPAQSIVSDEEKRNLLTKVLTDAEATPETRVAAAEALEDLGHIDCDCPLNEPSENGICVHEIEGGCTPA